MAAPKSTARSVDAAASGSSPWVMCLVAWIVPGAGHLLQGRARKGLVFLVVLLFMNSVGLAFGGRLFPVQVSDPLVGLASVAEWAIGLPRLVEGMGGFGAGIVTAASYEYGNTFLITAGLLNMLIVLDVFDFATGRKAA